MPKSLIIASLALPTFVLSACAPTETGNPPLAPPESGISDPVIDTVTGTSSCDDDGTCGDDVRIVSGNITVDVEDAEVWLFNLDNPALPYVFPVSSTGAFRLTVRGASATDLYRLQLRDGDVFYQPRHLRFARDSFAYVEHPQADCLGYTHTHRWSTSREVQVTIDNGCDIDLNITDATSWSGVSTVVSAPNVIAAGQRGRFVVRASMIGEDLLLLRTGNGVNQRLGINLVP